MVPFASFLCSLFLLIAILPALVDGSASVRTYALPNFDIETIVIDSDFDFELFRTSLSSAINSQVDDQLRQMLASNSTPGTESNATQLVSNSTSARTDNRTLSGTWESLRKAHFDQASLDVVYVRGVPDKSKGQSSVNPASTLVVGHFSGSAQFTFPDGSKPTDPNATAAVLDAALQEVFQGSGFDTLRSRLRTHPVLSSVVAIRIIMDGEPLIAEQIAPIPQPSSSGPSGALIAALVIAVLCAFVAVYMVCALRKRQKSSRKPKQSWKRPKSDSSDRNTQYTDSWVDEGDAVPSGSHAPPPESPMNTEMKPRGVAAASGQPESAGRKGAAGANRMNRPRRPPGKRKLPPGEKHPRAALSCINEADHESETDFDYAAGSSRDIPGSREESVISDCESPSEPSGASSIPQTNVHSPPTAGAIPREESKTLFFL